MPNTADPKERSLARRQDTRQRMLDSAVALLRERGANGVTLDAVLAHSGAPRGSIYHHFPGGRDQLVLEAGGLGGDFIAAMIEQFDGTPEDALTMFVDFWKQLLRDSEFTAGCPVVAVVVDHDSRTPEFTDLARRVFQRWSDGVARILREGGLPESEATSLSTASIAAIEGAILMCRVAGNTRALDEVASLLLDRYRALTRTD